MERKYLAIDLKSFYASCECVARRLDPLTARLVVADETRTDGTICLAVSPALKKFGISGRARLFEVKQKVNEINQEREIWRQGLGFGNMSKKEQERLLGGSPELAPLDFIIAPPRMRYYLKMSARIYGIYLRYIAPEDIHVYSVDEVFIDATPYLKLYKKSAGELAEFLMRKVFEETGITATAGVGTNLYLAKVAMDILAKHAEANEHGARLAELDEKGYREKLWAHRPITDFWRVGRGTARKLEKYGILTMGDIAKVSLRENGEGFLFKLFGVNAEFLIDHAWGKESCTMKDIKNYHAESHSLSVGQVLPRAYNLSEAKTIMREMSEELALRLVEKELMTDKIVLTVFFDGGGAKTMKIYGREMPHLHGTENLRDFTTSMRAIKEAVMKIFERGIEEQGILEDGRVGVKRIFVVAGRTKKKDETSIIARNDKKVKSGERQLSLFQEEKRAEEDFGKDERLGQAVKEIKTRFGKNAIVSGTSFEPEARSRERNEQIGGHKSE